MLRHLGTTAPACNVWRELAVARLPRHVPLFWVDTAYGPLDHPDERPINMQGSKCQESHRRHTAQAMMAQPILVLVALKSNEASVSLSYMKVCPIPSMHPSSLNYGFQPWVETQPETLRVWVQTFSRRELLIANIM